MATEAEDTSTDEQDGQEEQDEEQTSSGSDQKSQEQMTAEFEEAREKQYKESRRKIGRFQLMTTVLLVAIALGCLYFSQSVTGDHPLVQQILAGLGAGNLAGALAMQIRKNWSRTFILVLQPLTILGLVLTFTNTMKSSLLLCLVCIGVIYLMFRQPVLDEYDAPKE